MIERVTFQTHLGDGEACMERKPGWCASAIWRVNLPWRSFPFVGSRVDMIRTTESILRNDNTQQEDE